MDHVHHHIEYLTRTPAGLTTVVTHTSVIDVQHVINDIASGCATYSAGTDVRNLAHVKAIPCLSGAYLFANWHGSKRNNLHDVALATRDNRPVPIKDRTSTPSRAAIVRALFEAIRSVRHRGRRDDSERRPRV